MATKPPEHTFTEDISAVKEDQAQMTVYGLGNYRFELIHITGLVSLSVSLLVSAFVLCYLNYPCRRSLWSRPIGERLVVYLAACDMLFSISHTLDHSYMMATYDNPPDAACAAFAFFLNEFVLAQSLVVSFTALNAFAMVVRQKKISSGRYDWRLLVTSLGLPALIGLAAISTGHFGPSGMWCYIDRRRKLGPLLTNLVGTLLIATFLLNVACYGAVWYKLKNSAMTTTSKYHRSARIMMLFVAAFVAQWWAAVTYSFLAFFGNPHISVRWASVFFSNMGGVFNFISYIFFRKRLQKVGVASTKTVALTGTH